MWGATRRAWLITGCDPGELLAVLLIAGLLVLAAGTYILQMGARTALTESLMLSATDRVYWIETWANDGVRPEAETAPYVGDKQGKYFNASDVPTRDGTSSFTTAGDRRLPRGDVITMRPAFSDGVDSFSILYVCARAAPPPGFTVRGTDHTTFANEKLIAPCRSRI